MRAVAALEWQNFGHSSAAKRATLVATQKQQDKADRREVNLIVFTSKIRHIDSEQSLKSNHLCTKDTMNRLIRPALIATLPLLAAGAAEAVTILVNGSTCRRL